MSLVSQIDADIAVAMKAQEPDKLSTLRLIKNAIKNQQIESKSELDEAAVIKVLQKEAKQRRDSIDSYKQANRDDLVAKEEKELEVIQTYLPRAMGEAELKELVNQTITEIGATGPQDIGKVMGAVMQRTAGRADGGTVSALVKEQLGQ